MMLRPSRRLAAASATAALCLLFVLAILLRLIHHEEPILRARLIDHIEQRLNAKVEIGTVHLSFRPGTVIRGSGLRISRIGGNEATSPTITVDSFQLHGGLFAMLMQRPDSVTAYTQGAVITLPAGAGQGTPASAVNAGHQALSGSLMLDHLVATNSKILIQTPTTAGATALPPVELDLDTLMLGNIALGEPLAYEAVLEGLNHHAKLHSTGHIGPWNTNAPSELPIDGNYVLTALDLSVIHGLKGKVSAQGRDTGTLRHIVIEGSSDTPDLAFDTSARPSPLHTQYRAVLDGATGHLQLESATLQLGRSTVEATGTIKRALHPGLQLDLDLAIPANGGHIEDFLTLLESSRPATITGALTMTGHLAISPGPRPVIQRLLATGTASLTNAVWSSRSLQQEIDSISLRAQDRAHEAKDLAPDLPVEPSSVSGRYRVANGELDVIHVISQRPGAILVLDGRYELTGSQIDLYGVLRTAVPASHMTTGVKSLLIKPLDPLLKKHGAAMELPVELKGPKTDPHVGLDLMHHTRDAVTTETVRASPHP